MASLYNYIFFLGSQPNDKLHGSSGTRFFATSLRATNEASTQPGLSRTEGTKDSPSQICLSGHWLYAAYEETEDSKNL